MNGQRPAEDKFSEVCLLASEGSQKVVTPSSARTEKKWHAVADRAAKLYDSLSPEQQKRAANVPLVRHIVSNRETQAMLSERLGGFSEFF